MKKAVKGELFADLDAEKYSVPPLTPPPKDKRGYIYIITDKAFPDCFKIGRTIDMKKRQAAYNSDRPYPTAYLHCVSELFTDAHEVEKLLLAALYKNTPATTFSKEWFPISFLETAERYIGQAESHFSLEKKS